MKVVDEKESKEHREQANDEATSAEKTSQDGGGPQGSGGPQESGRPQDTESGAELSLEEQLAGAEARAAEYLEGWQRARAEFANARKRMERDRAEARRNATIDVVSRLLPILDDFERALETVPDDIAANNWFEGVALVHRKMHSILESVDIERIEALGKPFDPNVHEAVLQEESDEHESGSVIKELQKGYRLNDRVIRPAMVVVAA